jgi:hypothetical protein
MLAVAVGAAAFVSWAEKYVSYSEIPRVEMEADSGLADRDATPFRAAVAVKAAASAHVSKKAPTCAMAADRNHSFGMRWSETCLEPTCMVYCIVCIIIIV